MSNENKISPILVWDSRWPERLAQKLQSVGAASVTEWICRYPTEPYLWLAERLGDDVAAIQLERVHFDEAKKGNSLRRAALDSIVRDLHYHLKQGWKAIPDGDYDSACVFGDWSSRLIMADSTLRDVTRNVWLQLKCESPPIGWLPKDLNDQFITSAFAKKWPSS